MNGPVIEVEIKGNLNDFKKVGNEAKILARDTKKELDKSLLMNLDLNIANFQSKLEEARGKLRIAKKEGNKDAELSLRVETNKLSRDLTEAKRQLNNYVNTGDKDLSRLQAKFNQVTTGFSNNLKALSGTIAGVFGVQQFVGLSDTFIGMQNSLKQVTNSTAELDALQQKLLTTANNARVPVDTLTKSFVRFDLVNRQLGGTQDETLKILDSLSKGLSLTGATASEVSSVMLQLSQAFGSGRLQGDEFRSVAENFPMLLDILAKRLGVARGELKDLASDGKISSQVLKDALIEANDQINASFNNSQKTIGQAITQIRNDFIIKFGELDKNGGVTQGIVSGLEFIKNSLLSFTEVFPTLTGLLGGATVAIALFGGAITLLGGPITAIIAGVGGLVVGLGYLADKMGLTSENANSMSESQKQLNSLTDDYNEKVTKLNKNQEELNKKYEEGTIGSEEYTKATENNKKALDDLANSHSEVKKGLDIINDGQLDYIQKIQEINKLKLNTNEYNALISKIKETQQELLKQIRLQQLALQSKISGEIAKKDVGVSKTGAGTTLQSTKQLPGLGLDLSAIGGPKPKDFSQISKEVADNLKKGESEYNKKIAELKKAETDILNAIREGEKIIKQPTGGIGASGGSNKSGGGSKKTPEQLAEEANKKRIELETKRLEEEARLNIEAIKNSTLNEEEKAKAILNINKKLQEDILLLKGEDLKVEKDRAEEVIKLAKETEEARKKSVNSFYEEIDKRIKTSEGKIEDYQKKVDATAKKFKELKDSAVKEINDINRSLEDLGKETDIQVAERELKLLEEQKQSQKELNDLKVKGINISLAESIGKTTLQSIGTGDIGGNTVEDLLKVTELLENQKKIQEELTLAQQNRTQAIFDEIKRVSELSETQKILEEQQKNKAILEERKKIFEAIKNNEIINLDEIKDRKNRDDAEELINKQTQIQNELKIAQDGLNAEKQAIIDLYNEKRRIETEYSAFFKGEIDKRINDIKRLASEVRVANAEIKSLQAGQIVNNTTNNTNLGGVVNNSNVDLESFFRRLNP